MKQGMSHSGLVDFFEAKGVFKKLVTDLNTQVPTGEVITQFRKP